jgi:hypothetical protein
MFLLSGLFSFLGGSVFRMIWGEVSNFITAKQDHGFELERMKVQGELDAAQHARNQEAIKLQHDMGVDTIRVQADADIGRIETDGWFNAVQQAMKPIGVAWVDAWNGTIRPLAATIVLCLWVSALVQQGFVTNDWDRSVMGVVLGFFFADRMMGKKGK